MTEVNEILPGYRDIICRIEALSNAIATHRKNRQTGTPIAIIAMLAGCEDNQDYIRNGISEMKRILRKNKSNERMLPHYEKINSFFDEVITICENRLMSEEDVGQKIRDREVKFYGSYRQIGDKGAVVKRQHIKELRSLIKSYSHIISLPPTVEHLINNGKLPAPEKTLATVVTELRQHGVAI